MSKKITLIIADDHALVREGMRLVVSREADFDLLASTGDGLEALRLTQDLHPDVLVLDLGLPGIDGLEVARRLQKGVSPTRVLALSARTDAGSVRMARRLGLAGYVPKSDDCLELIEAIRATARGETCFSPSLADQLDDPAHMSAPDLTAREREILGCVGRGLSSKQIAVQLGISVATVVKHRENLGRKLGTRNAAEMAAYAAQYLLS